MSSETQIVILHLSPLVVFHQAQKRGRQNPMPALAQAFLSNFVLHQCTQPLHSQPSPFWLLERAEPWTNLGPCRVMLPEPRMLFHQLFPHFSFSSDITCPWRPAWLLYLREAAHRHGRPYTAGSAALAAYTHLMLEDRCLSSCSWPCCPASQHSPNTC